MPNEKSKREPIWPNYLSTLCDSHIGIPNCGKGDVADTDFHQYVGRSSDWHEFRSTKGNVRDQSEVDPRR